MIIAGIQKYSHLVGFLLLSLIIAPSSAVAQRGVDFRPDYYLEKAIQIAQIEDKNIFIDTYTPWCGPCKLMDIQFQDYDLGSFFNKNYINIKINMDSQYGPEIKKRYDVFFLPTLLIVDKYGNVKYASEGTLTSDQLLELGKNIHNEIYNPALASTKVDEAIAAKKTPKLKNSSTSKSNSKETEVIASQEKSIPSAGSLKPAVEPPTEVKGEKILYTQDGSKKSPDFLYRLTYLKLQLQDGTQWAAADEYLATQKDWSTLKNMRFIYDFVRRPNTKMFNHIIDNRSEYDVLFGQENVNRSISIMVNMRLHQGYPRPEREEILQLYNLLDPEVAEIAMFNTLLERYEMDENYEMFVPLALEYVRDHAPDDFAVINKIAIFSESSTTHISIHDLIELMEHAIDVQGGSYYVLYDTMAALYFRKGNKKKAIFNVEKALVLAKASGVDTKEIDQLRDMILEL